jgi:hypothetical protein
VTEPSVPDTRIATADLLKYYALDVSVIRVFGTASGGV